MEMPKPYCLGIDLNDQYAVVSYFREGMKEPDTISTVAGGDAYRIPATVAKRVGAPQWYYGDDARKMAKVCEIVYVDQLLRRAVDGDTITMEGERFEAERLLLLYLQKLILIPQKLGGSGHMGMLVITVEKLTRAHIELFRRIAEELQLDESRFMMMDHKQVFYYFALSQPKELWLHDVYLFEYEKERMHYYALRRNESTKPQVITIEESDVSTLPIDRDQGFLSLLMKVFANKIISTVYLVGEGFEGDWLHESVNYLCRTRRAFIGRNLFSKGACYAAQQLRRNEDRDYVYLSENDMKFNLSLKVLRAGEPVFYNLVSAGRNWFEAGGVCEVLLNGETGISFWKQLPYSSAAEIETLELSDIPQRPARATRLRIKADPVANDRIQITIEDLGFGEFFRSSNKTWTYTMVM